MAREFRRTDRDQQFLMPPDVRDWVPPGHLVWFMLDVLEQLDTSAFEARARLGGAGRAPYEPRMLLGVLLYGYALGVRSSRQLERLCEVDVAFRVLTGNQHPDHVTLARFRAAHQDLMKQLFTQVLVLCARAGLGRLGTVSIDGTKIAADASWQANGDRERLEKLAGQVVDEAATVDDAEDKLFGDARGDELPPGWRDRNGRGRRIAQALAGIEAEEQARAEQVATARAAVATRRIAQAEASVQRERAKVTASHQARAEREAATGKKTGRPCQAPIDEHARVKRALHQLDQAHAAAAAKATKPVKPQRKGKTTPVRNITDPDSRRMPTGKGWLQGYNAQLAVTDDQLILAATVTTTPVDTDQLVPMMAAATQAAQTVADAQPPSDSDTHSTDTDTDTDDDGGGGGGGPIGVILADAGYHSTDNLQAPGPARLIAPGNRHNQKKRATTNPTSGPPPPDASVLEANDHRLRTPEGHAAYARRAVTVEPVNGHLKDRIGLRRFARRGLPATQAELDLAATVANLLKLYRACPA